MKSLLLQSFLFFSFVIILPTIIVAQESDRFELTYKIHKVYPYSSISHAQMIKAKTLSDLNQYYKSSWVKEYKSIEISSIQDRKEVNTYSQNEILTEEQLKQIRTADKGSKINVTIEYLPLNNLEQNDIKINQFSITVDPEIVAEYPGGQSKLDEYIKQSASDNVSDTVFKQYNLTAITFSIDEEGNIFNAEVSESSNDEKTDQVLLESICNMPKWSPASYSNGQKATQDFVFTVGDSTSCTMNFFHTRPFPKYLE